MSEIWSGAFCACDRKTKRRHIYRITDSRLEALCHARSDSDAYLDEVMLRGADVSTMPFEEALALGKVELIGEVTGFAIVDNFGGRSPSGVRETETKIILEDE